MAATGTTAKDAAEQTTTPARRAVVAATAAIALHEVKNLAKHHGHLRWSALEHAQEPQQEQNQNHYHNHANNAVWSAHMLPLSEEPRGS